MTGPLLSDLEAGGVLMLTLNRPTARNAIDAGLRAALRAAFLQASGDAAVRAVVLAGAGGHFCAGGDIASMAAMSADDARSRMADVAETAHAVAACGKPVIACVKGHAAGAGVGLALLCDEVVADHDARFTFSFVRLGLRPDWGLTATLPRRVGQAAAQRLVRDGAQVAAAAALQMQLIDHLAGGHDALSDATDRAITLAAAPAPAVAATKSRFHTPLAELDAALAREGEAQARCFASPAFAARLAEFREKRRHRQDRKDLTEGKKK
ncbi:MAG TPA: enoyl-CoA hydratase/isomerase family protein [Afifellaceae bacterium]|nr:enoyl-CoA hydratase/isomerase family protein [Afifellaceae bacterium]